MDKKDIDMVAEMFGGLPSFWVTPNSPQEDVPNLLAEQASVMLRSLGSKIPASDILEALSCPSRDLKALARRHKNIKIERDDSSDYSPVELSFLVGGEWEVKITAAKASPGDPSPLTSPSVEVFYLPKGDRERKYLQDTPDGKPSQIVLAGSVPFTNKSGTLSYFAYIKQEVHYNAGAKCNPKSDQPAEVHYYESGQIKDRISYHQRGKMGSPDPNTPCAERFWENGQLHVVEFGDADHGRHRAKKHGPAYAEYFPNGVAALEVFASLDRRGHRRLHGWACRQADGSSREATSYDLSLIKSPTLTLLEKEDCEPEVAVDPELGDGFTCRHGAPSDWRPDPAKDAPPRPPVLPSNKKARSLRPSRTGSRRHSRASIE